MIIIIIDKIISGGSTYEIKKHYFLYCLSLPFYFLAACGNKEEKNESAGNDAKEETYTVEHAMGTTEIKGTPKESRHPYK